MTTTCQTCRFWNDCLYGRGGCRRYAPRPFVDGEKGMTLWPFTESDDWCGEHQPIAAETTTVTFTPCPHCGLHHGTLPCIISAPPPNPPFNPFAGGTPTLCLRCGRTHDPSAGCAPTISYSGIAG